MGHYLSSRLIFKQDESPWPAPLFIAALKAYGVETEDLLAIGRKFLFLGKNYIEEVKNNYSNTAEKKHTHK